MKQSISVCYAVILGIGLVTVLNGCATKPQPVPESWIESRPLGANLFTYRPPREVTVEPAPSAFNEPAGALTLRQALALALAHNPELAAFSWDVRIGEARTLQAGLRPNPKVGVQVENVLGTGDFSAVREAETTLQLSQLIELGGKRVARVKAASLDRDLAGWNYETARIAIFTKTAKAFVEVLSLQQRLKLAKETVNLSEKVVKAVNKRVEAARTFAVEGTKAQVALASMQIEHDQTQKALNAARQRLTANWGNTQPHFKTVEGNLEQLTEVPGQDQLLERLHKNPDLDRWTTEILQREATLDLEMSKRVPDITVGGGYRRLNGQDDNAFVAGVSIPLPLYNKNQGNIQEAKFRLAQAQNEQRAAELRVTTALGQAWQRLSAAQAKVTALKEKVLPSAQLTFETTSQYYSEGRLSYLEVLDAQRTLFTARAQYFRTLNDYHQGVLAVEQLIGEALFSNTKLP